MLARLLLISLALVSSLNAANIQQVISQSSWLDPEAWSNNATPTATNAYFLREGTDPPDALGLRGILFTTPPGNITSGSSSNFTGRSLEVSQSETLTVRQTGTNTASIRNGAGTLTLRGGTIAFRPRQGGARPTLDVNLFQLDNVNRNTTIHMTRDTQATIDGELRGGGDLFITERRNGNVSDARFTITRVNSARFTGDITVTDDITLDFNSDVNFQGEISIGRESKLNVDQIFRFRSGNLSDSENGVIPDGVYMGSDLAALNGKYLDGGGALIVGNPALPVFTVTTLTDEIANPGDGFSLREAIASASVGIINFDPSLDGGTIQLDPARGPLRMTRGLTIDASALSNRIIIDGGSNGDRTKDANETRCLIIDDNQDSNLISVTLRGLTIQNGVTEREGDFSNEGDNGANIYNIESLTLIDCQILNGRVESGAGVRAGGIYCEFGSRLTVRDSLISGNAGEGIRFQSASSSNALGSVFLRAEHSTFSNNGIGIDARAAGFGPGSGDPIEITDSLFTENNRGISTFGLPLRVRSSTFANNSGTGANADGGAIRFFAGTDLSLGISTMELINSTFVGNVARRDGGAIDHIGPLGLDGRFSTISGCTIIGNRTLDGNGGGIENFRDSNKLRISNSLIIGNQAGGGGNDANGGFTNGGGNRIGIPGGSSLSTFVETSGGEALLQQNGGPTPTVQLVSNSPAINAGSNSEVPDGTTTDQRGAFRILDNRVDIGAVEFSSFRIVTTLADELDEVAEDGTGISLREALRDVSSSANTRITFDPSLNGGVIFLNADLRALRIDKSVTIDATDLSDGIIIDGGSDGDDLAEPGELRCMVITDSDFSVALDVSLINLTVQKGVEDNQFGGGPNIVNRENLQLINCRILDGRYLGEGDRGGGINSSAGKLTLIDCFVSGNRTTGANAHGGGIFVSDECEIIRTTISGNRTTGLGANGGGVATREDRPSNNLVVERSTIANNNTSQGQGGGIFFGDGTGAYEHCTIVENTGAGIFLADTASNSLTATVVRDNSGGDIEGSASATYQTSGNNIVGTGNRLNDFGPAEISTSPLHLAPLENVGGLTPVRVPQPGSVVINRAFGSNNRVDQTGFATIGIPDVGAVEFRGILITTLADELNNDDDVSLREALRDVTPELPEIFFDTALSGGIIQLDASRGPIVIDKAITLDATSLAGGITIDGGSNGDLVRQSTETTCFSVTDEDAGNVLTITLRGLIIQNGVGNNASNIINTEALTLENCQILDGRRGAGISSSRDGSLVMRDCLVSGHQTTGTSSNAAGAGLRLALGGTATLERCTFSNNRGQGDGGAIGLGNNAELTVRDSHFTGNTGRRGGAIHILDSNATITGTTFSNNTAAGSIASGGALNIDGRSRNTHIVNIARSTFTGNSSPERVAGAITTRESTLNLTHCTIVDNTGPEGETGGVEIGFNATANIRFSILRDNPGGDIASASFGTVNSLGGNIVGTGNRVSVFGEEEQNTAPILLVPLGNFGGPTSTRPPLEGSPAIANALQSNATVDQRGFPIIGIPDVGAAESEFVIDFFSDTDRDGLPLFAERALGTDPDAPSFGDEKLLGFARNNGQIVVGPNGEFVLSFGRGSRPLPGTILVVECSTSLQQGSFQEIYRFEFDTNTSISAPGFRGGSFRDTFSVLIETPDDTAFYRLKIESVR